MALPEIPLESSLDTRSPLLVVHRPPPLDSEDEWAQMAFALVERAGETFKQLGGVSLQDTQVSNIWEDLMTKMAYYLERHDVETQQHTNRVTDLTIQLAASMRVFDSDGIIQIRRGAMFHDIGKLFIPLSILQKNGPLTDEERSIMNQHPLYAYNLLFILRNVLGEEALDIPYCHHEWWDGGGYPRGLRGEEIPLSARLFAVVDVWDALRSKRVYRPEVPVKEAKARILEGSGTQFEPRIVKHFLEIAGRIDPRP